MRYNPSDVAKKGSIFGLPYSREEADVVLLPVHLETTVSYREGTAQSPNLILEESAQLDLSLPSVDKPWELKLFFEDRLVDKDKHDESRGRAKRVIDHLEAGIPPDKKDIEEVNEYCRLVHQQVEETCKSHLAKGKWVGIIGGEHSSPLGLINALSSEHHFGILQVDAHMDLRNAYEGFAYSHASIMYQALKAEGVKSLTQVGIRDYSEEEENYIADSSKKISVFFDEVLFQQRVHGTLWSDQVKEIINTLPDNVYLSFDVDGLEPSLCPNTGTPVPGGLTFQEAIFLIEEVVRSERKIIGFDVCEAGNAQWDANVGARIIYRLAVAMGVSQGQLEFR
ncbi:MAG: agmatinase family protein [Bacteroidota bacterium]